MAIAIEIDCADEAEAWCAIERMTEAWCVDIDPVSHRVRALLGTETTFGRKVPVRVADFGSGWREKQKATQIGPLWIVSPGRKVPGARFLVTVDALIAFGAGTHETTMMCLERIVELSPIDEILDVGTGSGILAIAALKMGATRARGVDIEEKLLNEARENARRNGVTLELSSHLERTAPVVIANVRTPALVTMAPALIGASKQHLILSGIRVEEREEIVPVYEALGARIRNEAVRGDWLRLDFVTS